MNVLLVISPLVKNCRATNPQKLSYTPFIYTVSPQESGTLEKTTNLKPSLYLADRCGKYKFTDCLPCLYHGGTSLLSIKDSPYTLKSDALSQRPTSFSSHHSSIFSIMQDAQVVAEMRAAILPHRVSLQIPVTKYTTTS